jgi:hypothetical protein
MNSRKEFTMSTEQTLVEELSKKYLRPEQALKYMIDQKIRLGKTREEAIKELARENI